MLKRDHAALRQVLDNKPGVTFSLLMRLLHDQYMCGAIVPQTGQLLAFNLATISPKGLSPLLKPLIKPLCAAKGAHTHLSSSNRPGTSSDGWLASFMRRLISPQCPVAAPCSLERSPSLLLLAADLPSVCPSFRSRAAVANTRLLSFTFLSLLPSRHPS